MHQPYDALRNDDRPMSTLRTAHVSIEDPDPIGALSRALGGEAFAIILLFVGAEAPFRRIATQAAGAFGAAQVVACTTAGEISADGYTENEIVAVGLPARHFVVDTLMIDSLDAINADATVANLIHKRGALAARRADWRHDFAFLLIDGLSLREDELVSIVDAGLGGAPMFGGSAGDGVAFDETMIALNGVIRTNAAIIMLARTACPLRVFSLDHLTPTDQRMVVTKADSTRRIVRELNAEPAAREYARILGKDPNRLSPFTFAAHPLMVRVGNEHHVRAIQRVTEDDELVFFSAIDEGLVLSLSEPDDLVIHLERSLTALAAHGRPDAILACDCILRRLEAEQKQMSRRVSAILSAHRAIGFSTYGEQFRAMHVNQTMTGVAFYRPDA